LSRCWCLGRETSHTRSQTQRLAIISARSLTSPLVSNLATHASLPLPRLSVFPCVSFDRPSVRVSNLAGGYFSASPVQFAVLVNSREKLSDASRTLSKHFAYMIDSNPPDNASIVSGRSLWVVT
jgi:hypothetical protein